MTPSDGQRADRAPLFIESWHGVIDRLKDLYSKKSKVVGGDADVAVIPTSNPAALRRMLQQTAQPLQLPVVGVTPTNVDPNEASFNAAVMRKHGASLRISEDENFWYVLKARPVVLTFQVTLVTDDVETLLRMVDRWESCEVWGFTLSVPATPVKVIIKVVPDKSLSIPPVGPGPDGADCFELTTNLKVETMAGFLWRVPSVRAVEMTTNMAKSTIAAALEDPEQSVFVADAKFTKVDLDSPLKISNTES